MTTFRVHFADGRTVDIAAEDPKQAREIAKERHSGIIAKIKVVRENANV